MLPEVECHGGGLQVRGGQTPYDSDKLQDVNRDCSDVRSAEPCNRIDLAGPDLGAERLHLGNEAVTTAAT
jgi:hypothetical protein